MKYAFCFPKPEIILGLVAVALSQYSFSAESSSYTNSQIDFVQSIPSPADLSATLFSMPADLNGDGQLDFFDVSMFLATMPDWNGDTTFAFLPSIRTTSTHVRAFGQYKQRRGGGISRGDEEGPREREGQHGQSARPNEEECQQAPKR